MTRKEIYENIKSMNLADEIKAVFGDNFTRVSNVELEKFIASKKPAKKATKSVKNAIVDPAIVRLVSTLQAGCVITKADANFILTGK